jgi:hypothetical protein
VKLSGKQVAGIIIAVLIMTAIANHESFLPYRWQPFNAPDGSFAAQFPGKPEAEERQGQLTAGGTITLHQITATPVNTTTYSCVYSEDPRLLTESTEEVLNAARDGSISNVHGTLISEKRLDVAGHSARDVEAQAHAQGNSLLDMRIIVVGRRMFVLMVVDAARKKPDTKNIQKFFDSFKFSE